MHKLFFFFFFFLLILGANAAHGHDGPLYYAGVACPTQEAATEIAMGFRRGGNEAAFVVFQRQTGANRCLVVTVRQRALVLHTALVSEHSYRNLFMSVVRARISTISTDVYILPTTEQQAPLPLV